MRVSFNRRHRKGLTLDSRRERPPDQCWVTHRVVRFRIQGFLSRNL